jgi:hypothetical protein
MGMNNFFSTSSILIGKLGSAGEKRSQNTRVANISQSAGITKFDALLVRESVVNGLGFHDPKHGLQTSVVVEDI